MQLTDQQRQQFRETGFLILRGLLSPEETRRYFGELDALLRAAFGAPYDDQTAHWVPATDRYTPFAAGLLADERFRGIATELLGRPILGEGTDGSYYVGDTRWHHDAVHPDLFEAVKFTLYGAPVDGASGALRLVPGSHRLPLHDELTQKAKDAARRADSFPAVVFESAPGDAVVFDVRVWHGAFNGACRIAGSVNYRIDPETDHEIAACQSYFARSHRHVGERYGAALALYPEYFRSLPDPQHRRWVSRLNELGVLDPPPKDDPRSTDPSSREVSQ